MVGSVGRSSNHSFGRSLGPGSRSRYATAGERHAVARAVSEELNSPREALRARQDRQREVLLKGVDVLVHTAPEWAGAESTWTRIRATKTVWIEADEMTAAAICSARYSENPYRNVHVEVCEPIEYRHESLVRASAHDRNATLAGGLLDEATPEDPLAAVLSVQDLLDDARNYDVIRAGEWTAQELAQALGRPEAPPEGTRPPVSMGECPVTPEDPISEDAYDAVMAAMDRMIAKADSKPAEEAPPGLS
jgi:hypothetical protein